MRTRDSFAILDSGIDLACVHFGVGNFDSALCAAESAEKTAKKCFARDREAFLLFIKGRIFFETGDYHTAELMFQAAVSLATLYNFSEQAAIARTWYGRVLVHQGRYHAAEPIFRNMPKRYLKQRLSCLSLRYCPVTVWTMRRPVIPLMLYVSREPHQAGTAGLKTAPFQE